MSLDAWAKKTAAKLARDVRFWEGAGMSRTAAVARAFQGSAAGPRVREAALAILDRETPPSRNPKRRKLRNPTAKSGQATVLVGQDLSYIREWGYNHLMPAVVDEGYQAVPVRTLQEASDVVGDYIRRTGMGGSSMGRKFGEVRLNGRLVARVSYNGRVWRPSKEPGDLGSEAITGAELTQPLGMNLRPKKRSNPRFAPNERSEAHVAYQIASGVDPEWARRYYGPPLSHPPFAPAPLSAEARHQTIADDAAYGRAMRKERSRRNPATKPAALEGYIKMLRENILLAVDQIDDGQYPQHDANTRRAIGESLLSLARTREAQKALDPEYPTPKVYIPRLTSRHIPPDLTLAELRSIRRYARWGDKTSPRTNLRRTPLTRRPL